MLLEFLDEVVDSEIEKLLEGVMDQLTTQLSRYIIKHLKYYNKYSTNNPVRVIFGGMSYDVNFRFQQTNTNTKIHGGFNPPNNIELTVKLPKNFFDSNLNWNNFIPVLKRDLRHELEHLQQYKRHEKAYGFDPNKTTSQDPIFQTHNNKQSISYGISDQTTRNIEYWKKYLLDPMEIEAFVMGLYKQAKTSKDDFWFVMHNFLSEKYEMMQELLIMSLEQKYGPAPNQEFSKNFPVELTKLDNYIENLRNIWTEYAKKRLPTKNFKFQDDENGG